MDVPAYPCLEAASRQCVCRAIRPPRDNVCAELSDERGLTRPLSGGLLWVGSTLLRPGGGEHFLPPPPLNLLDVGSTGPRFWPSLRDSPCFAFLSLPPPPGGRAHFFGFVQALLIQDPRGQASASWTARPSRTSASPPYPPPARTIIGLCPSGGDHHRRHPLAATIIGAAGVPLPSVHQYIKPSLAPEGAEALLTRSFGERRRP